MAGRIFRLAFRATRRKRGSRLAGLNPRHARQRGETGTSAGTTRFGVMSTNPKTPDPDQPGNAVKDPADWTTGDETMTGAQASYLKTLSEEAGEAFDPSLSKAEASRRIDALQAVTGRGRTH
jgi:Protein of unknown function (DUF3072)